MLSQDPSIGKAMSMLLKEKGNKVVAHLSHTNLMLPLKLTLVVISLSALFGQLMHGAP